MALPRTAQHGAAPALDVEKIHFGHLHRYFKSDLLRQEGDFLFQTHASGDDELLLLNQGQVVSFRFSRNSAPWFVGNKQFHSLNDLVNDCYKNGTVMNQTNGRFLTPVLNEPELIPYAALKLGDRISQGPLYEIKKAKLIFPSMADLGEQVVAVKILAPDANHLEKNQFALELRTSHLLNHRNVLNVTGVVRDGNRQIMILPFMNQGSMKRLLEAGVVSLDSDIVFALLDIAHGLSYLHAHGMSYGDLKADHCLGHQERRRRFRFRLCSFGLCQWKYNEHETSTSRKKTMQKLNAPEVNSTRVLTVAGDAWNYGMLMTEVYSRGRNPYIDHFDASHMDTRAVINYFKVETNRLNPPTSMPLELVEIMRSCLSAKPQNRPTMKGIIQKLIAYCEKKDYAYSG